MKLLKELTGRSKEPGIRLLKSLHEANLANKGELTNWTKDFLRNKLNRTSINSKPIWDWFLSQFVSYVERKEHNANWFQPHDYQPGEPEWMKKPDVVDFVGLSFNEISYLSHIIDYFEQLPSNELRKIGRQTFEQIEEKVEQWDEQLASKMQEKFSYGEEMVDYEVIDTLERGYKFVHLLSSLAYKSEGNLMGHCVGDYNPNRQEIYSLWDEKNLPHTTIEVKGGVVKQIQGKQNKEPKPEYLDLIESPLQKVAYRGNEILPFFSLEAWKRGNYKDLNLSGLGLTELPDLSSIEVRGDFYCGHNQLSSLEGSPRTVGGDFYCGNNQLTTLEGSPQTVGRSFICDSNQLSTLKGSPQTVGGDFYCDYNQLTTLEGGPQTVGGDFYCDYNQLTTLEGSPQKVGGDFYSNGNPLHTKDHPEGVQGDVFL